MAAAAALRPVLRSALCSARVAPLAMGTQSHLQLHYPQDKQQQRQISQSLPARSALTSKTGQTGLAVLGAGVAAYLLSKEILVLHYESVVVASVAGVTYLAIKKAGGSVASALDERAKSIQETLTVSRTKKIDQLQQDIADQKSNLQLVDSVQEVFDINRVCFPLLVSCLWLFVVPLAFLSVCTAALFVSLPLALFLLLASCFS